MLGLGQRAHHSYAPSLSHPYARALLRPTLCLKFTRREAVRDALLGEQSATDVSPDARAAALLDVLISHDPALAANPCASACFRIHTFESAWPLLAPHARRVAQVRRAVGRLGSEG